MQDKFHLQRMGWGSGSFYKVHKLHSENYNTSKRYIDNCIGSCVILIYGYDFLCIICCN